MSLRRFLGWVQDQVLSSHTTIETTRSIRTRLRRRQRQHCEPLETRCLLAAVTWDGGAGTTNWFDASNWSNNLVPASADDVTISNASVTYQASNLTANSLTLDSATLTFTESASNFLTLSAKQLEISTGSAVTVASSFPTLLVSSQTTLNFGGSDSSTQMGLTNAELSRISAANIRFQSTNATVASSPVVFPGATNVSFGGFSSVTQSLTAGGILTVGSAPKFSFAGTDVTASTLRLSTTLVATIQSPLVDTGYDQLKVAGVVDLRPFTMLGSSYDAPSLTLTSPYVPNRGETFTIVDNDGTDPVLGTFRGLSEGQIISVDRGAPILVQTYRISYVGGDGNDIVLTAVGSVTVTANAGVNDSWLLTRNGNRLQVIETTTNAIVADYDAQSVSAITLQTGDGNDTVQFNYGSVTGFPLTVTVDSGTGTDAASVFGGSVIFADYWSRATTQIDYFPVANPGLNGSLMTRVLTQNLETITSSTPTERVRLSTNDGVTTNAAWLDQPSPGSGLIRSRKQHSAGEAVLNFAAPIDQLEVSASGALEVGSISSFRRNFIFQTPGSLRLAGTLAVDAQANTFLPQRYFLAMTGSVEFLAGAQLSVDGHRNVAAFLTDAMTISSTATITTTSVTAGMHVARRTNGTATFGSKVSGSVSLLESELNRLQVPLLTIGWDPNYAFVYRTTDSWQLTQPATTFTGAVQMTGPLVIPVSLNLQNAGGTSATGNVTFASGRNLQVRGLSLSNAVLSMTGTGKITSLSGQVTLTSSTLQAADGDLALNCSYGAAGTSAIELTNSFIRTTGTGSISINNIGNQNFAGGKHGAYLRNNCRISAEGTGNVDLRMFGGTGSFSHGVLLENGARITSESGTVMIQGRGNGLVVGAENERMGVFLDFASQISTKTGTVDVRGSGGSSSTATTVSYGGNRGVFLRNGARIQATDGGSVVVTGFGGSGGSLNVGVDIVGTILSSFDPPIDSRISANGGSVTVNGFGGTGRDSQVGIGLWNGGKIQTFGNATSTVYGRGGTSPSITGWNYDLGISLAGDTNPANFDLSKTRAAITTENGALSVTAEGKGGGATNSGGGNWGLRVLNGSEISSSGSGTITINGTGGVGAGLNQGVNVVESYRHAATGVIYDSKIQSATAAINITGRGGNKGTYQDTYYWSHGVSLWNGGKVVSTGSAPITINGFGGDTGESEVGVEIGNDFNWVGTNRTVSKVETVNGNVVINGTGGVASRANDDFNYGINVFNGGWIESKGTGSITLNGLGGGTQTGTNITTANDLGISFSGYANNVFNPTTGITGIQRTGIVSANGNVTAIGTGGGNGTSTGSIGFNVDGGAELLGTGSANFTLTGTAGNNTGHGHGLFITGSGTHVATTDGILTLTGTGRGTAAIDHNNGVAIYNLPIVENLGFGQVIITGIAGPGPNSEAVEISGQAQVRHAINFSVLEVNADSVLLDTSGPANIFAGVVHIQPRTAGTTTNLGGADVLSGGNLQLGLSIAELGRIQSSSLSVGNDSLSTTFVTRPLVYATITGVILRGQDIVFSESGSISTNGNVYLYPASDGVVRSTSTAAFDVQTSSHLIIGDEVAEIGDSTRPLRIDAQYGLYVTTLAGASVYLEDVLPAYTRIESLQNGNGVVELSGIGFFLRGSERISDDAQIRLRHRVDWLFVENGGEGGYLPSEETIGSLILEDGSISGAGRLFATSGFELQSGEIRIELSGESGVRKTTTGSVFFIASNTGSTSEQGEPIFAGIHSYSETTAVESGTLWFEGVLRNNVPKSSMIVVSQGAYLNVSGQESGTIELREGQVLAGRGIIIGDISGTGTISPGNSPGRLTVHGSYRPVGNLDVEFNSATPETGYDQIVVHDLVELAGTLNVTIGSGFDILPGTPFTIIDNEGELPVVGTFDGLAEGSVLTIGVEHFKVSYQGGDGNDVVLTSALVVTNTLDSGLGSLRQAILDANDFFGPDLIIFAIPGSGPHVIVAETALPASEEGLIIDATTQLGYADLPLVEIRAGESLQPGVDGLELHGEHSEVRGLSVTGFGGYGLRIQDSWDFATVFNTWIGVSAVTRTPMGNHSGGIWVSGDSQFSGEQLVVSANGGDGIKVDSSVFAFHLSNSMIGTDVTGRSALGNAGYGVSIQQVDSPYELFTPVMIQLSTISGNLLGGLFIDDRRTTADHHVNYDIFDSGFGVDRDRSQAVPNGHFGIRIQQNATFQTDPGTAWIHSVTASGNNGYGLLMEHAGWWAVTDSQFGTDATGTFAIPNDVGMRIEDNYASWTENGPTTDSGFDSLVISGNRSDGLQITYADPAAAISSDGEPLRYSEWSIANSRIGTNREGTEAIPNGRGVVVEFLGNPDPDVDRSVDLDGVISGNLGYGVTVIGDGDRNKVYLGANIGTGPIGDELVANRGGGILVSSHSVVTTIYDGVIAFNRGPGVRVDGDGRNLAIESSAAAVGQTATFFGNIGLAVDIAGPGPSANTFVSGIPGSGMNDHPVITSAVLTETAGGRFLDVTGTNSPNGGRFLQFFTTRPTISGRGQGQNAVAGLAQFAGLSVPAAVTAFMADKPEPLRDLDLDANEFRFRIPVAPDFNSRLLTAVIVDPTRGTHNSVLPGSSEFSPIVPIGTQITALPPVVQAGASVQLFAGEALRRAVSFRDEDSVEFEVVVDYGDGEGFEYAQYRPADRVIQLEHVYRSSGSFLVSVSVLDDTMPTGLLDIDSFIVTVINTPPEIRFNEIELTRTAIEGEGVVLEGLFDDEGRGELHTVEVNWGDGTTSTIGPMLFPRVPGSDTARRFVLPPHVYLDDGISDADSHVYRVVVRVRDESGNESATPVFLVEVDNSLPTQLHGSLDASMIDEGSEVTLLGGFRDVGLLDTHEVFVNWGDGSPRERVSSAKIHQNGPQRTFALSHTYANNPSNTSAFSVTFEVADDDAQTDFLMLATPLSVTVANKPPQDVALLPGPATIQEGDVTSLFISFDDPGREEHFIIVNWGDGHIESFEAAPGQFSITPTHRYVADGTFIISATVQDSDLAYGSGSTSIVVTNLGPSIETPSLSENSISEGQTVTLTGTFADESIGEVYVVEVNWGDGSVTLAEVNSTTKSYRAKHRYEDDPTGSLNAYSIAVSVNDGTDSSDVAIQQIEVRNVAPVVTVLPLPETSSTKAVFRAFGSDVSEADQSGLTYTWTVTQGAASVPFVVRAGAPDIVEIDPADLMPTLSISTGPIFVTISVDVSDGDGGVTQTSADLIVGSEFNDTIIVTNSSFRFGQKRLMVLGLEGVDVLNASAITNPEFSVVLLGGAGNDLLFDGAGNDLILLATGDDTLNDPNNTLGITPNMGGDDRIEFIINSTQTAYDDIGNNTLSFDLSRSLLVAANGITFDLSQTVGSVGPGSVAVVQDVLPLSTEPNLHRAAALGRFNMLIGSHYGDTLTGASHSTVLGGPGADEFFTKDDITDATFGGGDDADVLTARGKRVARVRFDGDDGADELRVDELAEVFDTLDFDGGNDADVFVNRGRVSRVIFTGGADADVFRNVSGRIAKVRFDGDDGIDEFINEELAVIEWQAGDELTLLVDQGLEFKGGSDADVFVNRGRASRVIFTGGADADVFRNQSGRIAKVRFDGDDGADHFFNDDFATIGWESGDDLSLQPESGLTFNGGGDADVFVNRSRASRVIFTGGADADVFQNQRGRITRVHFDGDDGNDEFLNDEFATVEWQTGDDPTLIADQGLEFFGGKDADVFVNRGRASRVIFTGGADADVFQNQRGRITRVRFDGDDGNDQLINDEFAAVEWQTGDDPTLQLNAGIEFDGGNDADVFINRGRASRVIFTGGADADVFQNQRGRITRVRFDGDDGNDEFLNDEFAAVEWQTGDDPTLQLNAGIEFDGGNDADVFINRGRASRVIFTGGADADVLQNQKGRITKVRFDGDGGDDIFVNMADGIIARDELTEAEIDDGVEFTGGSALIVADPFGTPDSDADVFINRGRASRVIFTGGADADLLDLQAGEVTGEVHFTGGDDADVLIVRSRAGSVRFDGDAGPDEFLITGTIAGTAEGDGLVEFHGGDDADVFVSRGTLRKVIFTGGADDNGDDVLQTSGGSIQELEFISESGVGILVNRTNGIGSIRFTGSSEADMFINRGQNIGDITFIGGGGDDVFVNSGSTSASNPGTLTFDAGDGSNAMRNEGAGWAEVIYTGGLGEDFLQNNATGIGLLSYNGGTGSNVLENNASGISNIIVDGSDGNDIFANDGDNVSGIIFNALNGNNTLINTGANVSGITYNGGIDADRFINSGFALKDSRFHAEAGDDRLFNFGAGMQNVTMIGGAGADWWINQASAGSSHRLTLQAGEADNGDDVFINWAANVRNVVVEGGDGDDLLQNGGLSASNFQFAGGRGNDLLLNLGFGTDQFTFDAGDGDDVFENRGRNGGTLRMQGGTGDDAFYQNAGFASDIELNGGDGDDTLLTFSNGMGRVALIGGLGIDILQNSGNDIGSLELTGGDGKNTLQNFGHRVNAIRMSGSGTFAGAFDTLLNSGNAIGLINVTSNVATTVISSGNDITSLSVTGSELNDVVRVTGRNIQIITVYGNGGDDSLLVDTQSNVGSSLTYFGGLGDDLLILRGVIDGLLFDGGANEDQSVLSGSLNTAILRGGSGDDLYRFVGTPNGSVTIDEVFTGTSTVNDLSSDTLDFSSLTSGPITLDLAITTPQPQPTMAFPLLLTLTSGLGIENVVGTSGADTILGNARNNVISGAQFLTPGSSAPGTPIARTKTQWVLLDFVSSNDPGEHVYTEAEAAEVKHRIELAYTGFDVRFVLNANDLPTGIASDPSQYVTIYFNQTPSSGRPGGEASEIDFGNVNPGGIGTVQINGMLGGREVLEPGLKAVAAPSERADGDQIQAPDLPKPASTVENFIALSAKLGAHELGHLLGLRHYDAFGPVGFGIHSPPGLDRFKPTYSGIAAAFETMNHIISSPASIGSTRFNDLRQLYFGEREAIKLALAFSNQDDVRRSEPTAPHTTQATAAPLQLVTLDVPNLATEGVSKDKSFRVQAASVVGTIGLAGTTSESDWYSFTGHTGDIITIEVMSRALKRYYASNATSIDSVLRLYNAAGQLVQTFGADAVNDDEFESSDSLLMDVRLPAQGQYYIEVDTFRRLPGDASYEAAVALRAELQARRDDADPNNDLSPEEQQLLERLADSLDDTDTGCYELLMYRSTSTNATDGIDDIKGREGVDVIDGGPDDDYSLSVSALGAPSSNEASTWTGSYIIADRGGHSWTTVINYGDGSDPVTSSGHVGTAIPLSYIYADNGQFTITVKVTSDDGQSHTQTLIVDVNNVDPTASLSGPITGITGTPYTYTVTASDVAGVVDPLTYSWTITRNGAAFATQTGSTTYLLTAALPGSYTISVTVNDGDGGTITRSIITTVSPPPAVTAFDAGSGRTQRSWIDFLDVAFSSEQLAADLMANPNRIKLTRFGLNGPASASDPGTAINFTPAKNLSRSGSNVRLNFGAGVIGAGRNSNAADGYYRLSVDFDGDGIVDTSRYFYRLLGEVTGDRKVTGPATTAGTDVNRIQAGMTQLYNRELDINGDNAVNALDRYWAQSAVGRQLAPNLHLDD